MLVYCDDACHCANPVSRIFRSLPFVLPLFGTATVLRRRARAVRRPAEQDEKLERLAARPAGIGGDVQSLHTQADLAVRVYLQAEGRVGRE
jgi:hypothetical protein